MSLSVFLIALALYSVSHQKNFMENYSQGLNDTLNEAMNVRIELESIMENAVQITQTFVDKFEEKVSQGPETIAEAEMRIHSADRDFPQEQAFIPHQNNTPELVKVNPLVQSKANKIRVYELARDLHMPSKRLVKLINSLGIHINSHMNVLDENQLNLVRKAIEDGISMEADAAVNAALMEQGMNASAAQGSVVNIVLENEDPAYLEPLLQPVIQPAEQPLQELGFSIEELKTAHPYIAVKTLYENGLSIREIAQLLGRGQGEVSLILNLSQKKASVI